MAGRAASQELDLLTLVELGRNLLDQLMMFDSSTPERTWEPIVELEGLVGHLKQMRPPPAFRQQA
jgi:hypothetical protein